MKERVGTALAAALIVCSLASSSNAFPERPLTMVVPFAAGGPADLLGRVVASRMSEILNQPVVVENINGSGGMAGAARVANADPDGYQFVLGTVGTHAQGQTLYKHPLYDAVTDFTPSRTAHEAGFTHAERRKVVMQHEVLALLAFIGFKALPVVRRAQRGRDQSLRLAACKQG